jgi:hypothetical protein
MVDARVWKQVKDEERQTPVRFLEFFPLEGVAKALRRHSRGSQRVLEVYSLLALHLVRRTGAPTFSSSVPSPMSSWVADAGGYS